MENLFSPTLKTHFQQRILPEEGYLVGYAALIESYQLAVPLPDILSCIGLKHRRYIKEDWQIFTPRHQPENSLWGHLTFALKYEGIALWVLNALFGVVERKEITERILNEPTGQYSRKIWFLYEWLTENVLDIPDLKMGNLVDLVDESLQYGVEGKVSKRHKIKNNLPGVKDFCPMIRRTKALDDFIQSGLSEKIQRELAGIHPDVMVRAAAFLLLQDSKASYAIEGEQPPLNRLQRWGSVVGQAGKKPLNEVELARLQAIVLDNTRFTKMGWRTQEGFVGEHDRRHGTPIPDHISAKWQEVGQLMKGWMTTHEKLLDSRFDAVLAAAVLAFGFVFIHPFVDGNGRLHRYLIHHVLIEKGFAPPNLLFPVSAVILAHLNDYRRVLESYSRPRLAHIEWTPTSDYNVAIHNETIDLYRYFDATQQAEFLYQCVKETVEQTIPEEVAYLEKYDRFKHYVENHFEMPNKMVALLVRFLEQGNGQLSERAVTHEFNALTKDEVALIEGWYEELFG